jgi:hypothetical protein
MLQRLRYAHAAQGPGQCNLLARVELYGRETAGAANLPQPASCGFLRATVVPLQHYPDFYTAPHCRADCLVAYQTQSNEWGRVMTISSLQSREQITAISVEITDADFNRIEVIGDLIRHTEIVDAACPEATLARTSLSETHAA